MKKIIYILLASLAMVSCVDTIILPDDRTVEEDYWQKKSDVDKMVNGAYTALASSDVQTRLIVWNLRSDEYTVNTSLSNSALNQIYAEQIQTTNTYSNWAAFYSVINRCNIVIQKSEGVMSIDPDYLQSNHDNNVGQMKALRALVYFYLVRAYHDVPLILEPYTESSQEMNVAQSAPSVVLDQIISDLEEVKGNMLASSSTSSNLQRVGFFTKESVLALLADIYLWRASINRDASDYEKCVSCCDEIKDNLLYLSLTRNGRFNVMFDDDDMTLNNVENIYSPFLINDTEDLLSIQFSDNTALCNMYMKYKNSSNVKPYLYTNTKYSEVGDIFKNDKSGVFTDVRAYESVYAFGTGADSEILIRKLVSTSGRGGNTTLTETSSSRSYTSFAQNWNVYRITDVALMKAEALVQLASIKLQKGESLANELSNATDEQTKIDKGIKLQQINAEVSAKCVTAARLAQIINTRASTSETPITALSDSTKLGVSSTTITTATDAEKQISNYQTLLGYVGNVSTAGTLETLIMDERARELCFEGKRWYDMMRYNYRHMATKADYTKMLFDQTPLALNADFLDIIASKYTGSAGKTVIARMPTEPYLYMPILKSEMDVNTSLKQNPVYSDSETSSKN